MSKKVALALSSGGARGYAHIGVIETLEKRGYQIRSIAGSSMGAVVGGIYAAGKIDIYKKWVTSLEKIDVIKLLDLSFTKKGIFKGDKIINSLEKIIGDSDISNFDIKFTAVAVDIISQREVWFSKGSLFKALRASIAIPGIFTPHYYDNKILLDGGILNPLPIAPLLNDDVDLIVAVDVNSNKEPDLIDEKDFEDENLGVEDLNMFNILLQSINVMQSKIAKFKIASYTPDIIIEVSRKYCNIFDFDKAEFMIQIGREISDKTISKFEKNF